MLVGVLVGFAGIVLIARPWEGSDRSIDINGVFWMLAATTVLGVSYVYVRRFLSPYNQPPLVLATWQTGLALLVLLLVVDRTGMGNILQNWHAAAGVAICLGVLGTGMAFLIYYYLLQELGAVAARKNRPVGSRGYHPRSGEYRNVADRQAASGKAC